MMKIIILLLVIVAISFIPSSFANYTYYNENTTDETINNCYIEYLSGFSGCIPSWSEYYNFVETNTHTCEEVILDPPRVKSNKIIKIEISNEQINQESGMVTFTFPIDKTTNTNREVSPTKSMNLSFFIYANINLKYGYFEMTPQKEWIVEIPIDCIGELLSIGYGIDGNGMISTSDLLLQLISLDTQEDVVIDKIIPEIIEEEKPNGGGCTDCTPPTLGVNKDGKRMVDDGIKINGETIKVDYFYTEMPMQYTEIGQNNTISFKVYENNGPHNIKYFQFGLGVKEVGSSINESQALIGVELGYFKDDIYNPIIENIHITDKDGIIGFHDVNLDLTSCIDMIDDCLLVEITYNYSKVPISPVLGVNSWDYDRNVVDHFFNDGITVIDPNNTIEEIIKEEYTCKDPIQQVMTRNNCNFRAQTVLWDY